MIFGKVRLLVEPAPMNQSHEKTLLRRSLQTHERMVKGARKYVGHHHVGNGLFHCLKHVVLLACLCAD